MLESSFGRPSRRYLAPLFILALLVLGACSNPNSPLVDPPAGTPLVTGTPVQVYAPAIVNTSTDLEMANCAVVKGNLWYSPDTKKLHLAIKMRNNNAFPIDMFTKPVITLKNSAGTVIYVNGSWLTEISSTPMMISPTSVSAYSVAAGGDFYFYPLGDYSAITIGAADTPFLPSDIATIEVSGSSNKETLYSGYFFVPADRQIRIAGSAVRTDHAEVTLVNGSTSLSYDTNLMRLLALDASGSYIGVSEAYPTTTSYSGLDMIALSQTVTGYCFIRNYTGLAQISSFELVPYVSYKSGTY